MSSNGHIVQLSSLIMDSVKVVLAEYEKVGREVPSLDDTSPSPFDTPESVPLALSKAIRTIEAACAQLTYTVASPGHIMVNKTYAHCEIAGMLLVCNTKIADLLLDYPEGLSVSDLSQKSGLEMSKLHRILRLLATKHCFREASCKVHSVRPGVFANNRLSIKLLSADPVSSTVAQGADDLHKATACLNEILQDPSKGPSFEVKDCAFVSAWGSNPFEFYSKPENEMYAQRFGGAMIGWAEVTGSKMLSKVYPWKDHPQDTVICDVGGAKGHVTMDLVQAFPHLKIVLQDLPPLIQQATEFWKTDHPSAVANQRVSFVDFDFFKESPVPGCDFYYVTHSLQAVCDLIIQRVTLSSCVTHDWPDKQCIEILSNIRKVMKPTSHVLIQEIVLQNVALTSSESGDFIQAPLPLLPNYGVAQARQYNQDINMMAIFNSRERSLSDFIDLGTQVGLKFLRMWDTMETGIVEFIVA
ncbi:hypothetical protein D9757_006616 [Collybiopsis confluens]|uniref:S-adenosyl-L-methionine-dependent methyltransferase n=1 Tax=Collybiopsis confluens TaxID=2823264 RepID=A0A8H5MAQ8_9AGAR|nr:hypothetical protein D9757_006616 [Collybiopsis confluens]